MLQKLRSNQKGFTLIELMIVIAIIGILAAIAVPQFMAYRMRGYHSVANSDLRNFVAGQAALFEDGATYGMIDFTTDMQNAPGSGPINLAAQVDTVAGGNTLFESRPAQPIGNPGIKLTGTRQVQQLGGLVNLNFAFPISVGNGVELTTSLSITGLAPDYQDSYTMYVEHHKGIRAFAVDSDESTSIYFAEDENWNNFALGTFQSTTYAAIVDNLDIAGLASGAVGRNTIWSPTK